MTTNYQNTFIAVSQDTKAVVGSEPNLGTVASEQLILLRTHPYGYTSDELLFTIYAERNGIQKSSRASAFEVFISKPRACLRASTLVKQFGWGFHHDGNAKVAAYGMETEGYQRLSTQGNIKQTKGMRAKRS